MPGEFLIFFHLRNIKCCWEGLFENLIICRKTAQASWKYQWCVVYICFGWL